MARKTLYYIHVHQQKMKSNLKAIKNGANPDDLEDPILVKKGKSKTHFTAKEIILGACKMIYDAMGGKILPCGARLVLITEIEPIKVR